MVILDRAISRGELRSMAAGRFGDMVKGVADIDRGLLILDADLHADLAAALMEQGSCWESMWGIALYPEQDGEEFLCFDSLLNIRPAQGNLGQRVEYAALREKIAEVVRKWIRE